MRNMDYAVQGFVDAIKATEEYQDYSNEKNKVKQFPELKAQLDEYRRRSYELQSRDDAEFEKMEQLEKEYSVLRENQLVEDFLAAELAFCRLMQAVNLRVTDSLDFE